MTLILLEEAEAEFADAVFYYEGIESGLGKRFRDEVSATLAWIVEHPTASRLRPGSYYRINLRIFPYYTAYIIREEKLWVLAIAHGHRKPHYWIGRTKRS